MNSDLLKKSRAKAQEWLKSPIDEDSKKEIKALLEKDDPKQLIDSFYKDLEFGTGGLRAIMGVGSNCMNRYTVGSATQGLSNYLKKSFPNQTIQFAIAYNSRNNSKRFDSVISDAF